MDDSLDSTTRHAKSNEQARERAAEQLGPAMRAALAKWLEVPEADLPSARDAIKRMMREQKTRDERKNDGIKEVLKWLVGAITGAVGLWFTTHVINGGGPKP